MNVVETNVAIHCGGIAVRPGDLIFADVDGIVVVPQELVDEAISRAWEKVNGESSFEMLYVQERASPRYSRSTEFFERWCSGASPRTAAACAEPRSNERM